MKGWIKYIAIGTTSFLLTKAIQQEDPSLPTKIQNLESKAIIEEYNIPLSDQTEIEKLTKLCNYGLIPMNEYNDALNNTYSKK